MDPTLSPELSSSIGDEKTDFIVRARSLIPAHDIRFLTIFSIFWLTITGINAVFFIGPVLIGKEVHFKSGGIDVVAGPGNLSPLFVPGIAITLFLIIGIIILSCAMYSKFADGGFFVGTKNRLIHHTKKTLRSIDWDQFNGDIDVRGDNQKGDISLVMKTGRIRTKKGHERFIPDRINICSIPNVYSIGEICRKRIKENDTTIPVENLPLAC